MAVADIVNRTKTILYGSGLGEKPTIRQGAADAAETITGNTVVFTVASGEGAKIKPGNIISTWGETEATTHALYVLSVATDAVTAVHGYLGSAVTIADSLDGVLFEQNPLATEFEIYEAIDTIFTNMLWPHVYNVVEATIASPDLIDGQEAVAAAAEHIHYAYQIIGPSVIDIPFQSEPRVVATALASTGRLGQFEWQTATTGYYQYREKYDEADETTDELTHLVATGAAAIVLGASLVEATIEGTKKDNVEAVSQRGAVGTSLWRDFLTLRANMSEELTKRLPSRILVHRD